MESETVKWGAHLLVQISKGRATSVPSETTEISKERMLDYNQQTKLYIYMAVLFLRNMCKLQLQNKQNTSQRFLALAEAVTLCHR